MISATAPVADSVALPSWLGVELDDENGHGLAWHGGRYRGLRGSSELVGRPVEMRQCDGDVRSEGRLWGGGSQP